MTEKKKILMAYDNYVESKSMNRMGCSEDWYNQYFAISRTFKREEVEAMNDETIDYLIRLACSMSNALY